MACVCSPEEDGSVEEAVVSMAFNSSEFELSGELWLDGSASGFVAEYQLVTSSG